MLWIINVRMEILEHHVYSAYISGLGQPCWENPVAIKVCEMGSNMCSVFHCGNNSHHLGQFGFYFVRLNFLRRNILKFQCKIWFLLTLSSSAQLCPMYNEFFSVISFYAPLAAWCGMCKNVANMFNCALTEIMHYNKYEKGVCVRKGWFSALLCTCLGTSLGVMETCSVSTPALNRNHNKHCYSMNVFMTSDYFEKNV